jgi:hypothetical protein
VNAAVPFNDMLFRWLLSSRAGKNHKFLSNAMTPENVRLNARGKKKKNKRKRKETAELLRRSNF